MSFDREYYKQAKELTLSNLRNRHFLKLLDFSPQEIKFLMDLSVDLKKAKYAGL